MRFSPAAVAQIARCICGDMPLPFPYRTGKQIGEFFRGLAIDHQLVGSRLSSVQELLTAINLTAPTTGNMPSDDMVAIVEELMNRGYFNEVSQSNSVDFREAMEKINGILADYALELIPNNAGLLSKLQPIDSLYVSSATTRHESTRKITFRPSVFRVPAEETANDLVAVMMPFTQNFSQVYEAIKSSCKDARLRCQRVDDVWTDSTIIQDIFSLIFRSNIVVVDFTGKNPNVMYETGIAHTLGKHVVPVTQSIDDVPFDLRHHRVLKYLSNGEGLSKFQTELANRFVTILDQDAMFNYRS